MNPVLNSSKKMDWTTPDSLLELVRQVGSIALDPCTSPTNPTGAAMWVYPERATPDSAVFVDHEAHDGLTVDWARMAGHARSAGFGGLVYVNPPYGRDLPHWVRKCQAEAAKGCEIILLTPARPDTHWFQNAVSAFGVAPIVLFWRGRLKFKGAKDSAPFPSALFYWGPRLYRFRQVFDGKGIFL